MHPIARRRIVLSGSVLDSDYKLVLTSGIGTIPSASQQVLQNQMVKNLKASGIWDKLDLFYCFATDGDSSFACINWKNPGQFTITKVSSPAFTANQGFKGDGVSAYLNTNFQLSSNSVNYKQNDACRFMWVRTAGTLFFAEGNLVDSTFDLIGLSNSTIKRINSGSTAGNIDFSGTGLKSLNRTDASTVIGFSNTAQTSTTAASSAIPGQTKTLLAAGASRTDQQFSFYGLGANLVNENTSLYTILNTYLSSI